MSQEETSLYHLLARKIFLKQASDAERAQFGTEHSRRIGGIPASAAHIDSAAHVALVRQYTNLKKRKKIDEAQQYHDLLTSQKSPLSEQAVRKIYNIGESHSLKKRLSNQEGPERFRLSMLVLENDSEGNVNTLLEFYARHGLAAKKETCRHEAAIYLATRVVYLKTVLPRVEEGKHKALLEKEKQVVEEKLNKHAGTSSVNLITSRRIFLPPLPLTAAQVLAAAGPPASPDANSDDLPSIDSSDFDWEGVDWDNFRDD